MATFWTSVGVMLIPIGLAILIQWPNQYFWAFVMMALGVILGIIGLRFTIRDDRERQKESKAVEKRRKKDDKRRYREHYLYTLTQFEILKSLGGSPRIVSIKYRRWLENELEKEERAKEEFEDDEL